MRETNHRSIATNKPVVTITSTLYDRRALDVVSGVPLINSLNHLTYLTSNSAKVRDIISNDGALERLVAMLHNCYFSQLEILNQKDTHDSNEIRSDLVSRQQTCALYAWRWTLAFQCLVLTGTRGSEMIRNRVVSAGVLPLLATVLDNYLLFTKNYDFMNGTYLSFDFKKMNLDSHETYELLKKSNSETFQDYLTNIIGEDIFHLSEDIERFDEILLKKKMTKATDFGIIWKSLEEDTTPPLDTDTNCFLDETEPVPAILTPREFYLGRVVPKQDDVIWSLQLLAFISKYTYMKKLLQEVTPDERLSFRPIIDRVRKRLIIKKGQSLPIPCITGKDTQMDHDLSAENDTFKLEVKNSDINIKDDFLNVGDEYDSSSLSQVENYVENDSNLVIDEDIEMESTITPNENDFLKELRCVAEECDKLNTTKHDIVTCEVTNPYQYMGFQIQEENNLTRIQKELFLKEKFVKNWNYEELSMNVDNHDLHKPLTDLESLNIFPLVEKYTVTSDNPKDVIYWSSVIMRNSCRKNETTGVRQCSNFSCGKWEEYPRQFAKCRRCKRTKYCSRSCQLKAWTYHRYWCHEASSSSKNSASNVGLESDATTPNGGQSGGNSTDISEVIATNMSNLSTTEVGNDEVGQIETHVNHLDSNDNNNNEEEEGEDGS
ncbi:similar to Saccharomyces cerevisiae YMR100W MUB1 MYND domain-containing protein required for ubiquitination and turnover of Rpn4p [Maudiozyma saulgeensis]|uniref:Similar to Saccharomyces cerevisiae YMR100W MUB1 MYND domain-containing protein required for ubiquitination and turnover of Rpn4p n=1 Tax=Maudiozyma saulgeensis TaxID=1789683 RepID=A0A1X7R0H9_9SACH|nr:similar to Saccharomyces cerevisiae YMR100W MUB1 MYND domain-containing protein required for ubiquitination and turnover of Rpn4p [Kazachstania saulgeensis]